MGDNHLECLGSRFQQQCHHFLANLHQVLSHLEHYGKKALHSPKVEIVTREEIVTRAMIDFAIEVQMMSS